MAAKSYKKSGKYKLEEIYINQKTLLISWCKQLTRYNIKLNENLLKIAVKLNYLIYLINASFRFATIIEQIW